MIYIGVDPGLYGALAVWEPRAQRLEVHDMPTLRLKPRSTARTLDAVALATLADAVCGGQSIALGVIEQAIAMQRDKGRQSAAAVHKNGANWGMAYMAMVAQFVPVDIVPAHAWKAHMRCPAAKDGARARASQMMPRHAHLWPLVKHDGRAEAALLALYAEQRHKSRAVQP